ncbi:unnamed protein product, partial [marine sediment metagenome]
MAAKPGAALFLWPLPEGADAWRRYRFYGEAQSVTAGLVYVAGYNGKVYAINTDSGAVRWVYPREGELQPIVGGAVAILDKVYFGGSDGIVYALDAATGDRQWKFETGDKIWSTPSVSGDTLYIGSF